MLIPIADLEEWRAAHLDAHVVLTNGCFDVFHAGHARFLRQARALGDILLVALNSDASVRALKGPARPVNPAPDRVAVLLALRAVDAVCVFDSPTVAGIISAARPHVWVKGGDYTEGSAPGVPGSACVPHAFPGVPPGNLPHSPVSGGTLPPTGRDGTRALPAPGTGALPKTLDPGEVAAARECGARIALLPLLEGRSSTALLERLSRK